MSRHPALALAVGCIFGVGCAVPISERDAFHPNQEHRRPSGAILTLDGEDSLRGANLSIRHRRLPLLGLSGSEPVHIAVTFADTDAAADSKRLIVHCAGSGSERKSDGVFILRKLRQFGDVLMFDYPGYGDSEGEPDPEQLEGAARTVAEWVRSYEAHELVTWGHSMGGFVCARILSLLADEVDVAVFETSARSAAAVARAWTPWFAKPFVRVQVSESLAAYDNAAALRDFSGRALVLGAGRDESLPVSLSRELAASLEQVGVATRYEEFDEATHMDVSLQPDFVARLTRFFEGE